MKKTWQISAAGVCYFFFGLGAFTVGLMFRLLAFIPFIPARERQSWVRGWIHNGCLAFIIMMRLFGLIRYTFELDSLLESKSGNLIIANHPTLIDVVLLFAVHRDLNCIVKGALWDNFFTGAVVKQAGFIPNHTASVSMAVEKLQMGESLLIFPEGTRKDNSNNMQFKRGAANLAVLSNSPILPILIKCNPSALKKGDKWYKIPDGGPNFILTASQPIFLQDCIDTSKPKTLQYRELTRYLETYYQNWITAGDPKMPVINQNNNE